LGFLAAGLALLVAGVTAVAHEDVAMYALATIGLVFCAGLAVINRRLHIDTSVGTPWKQSLYAVAAILVALALYGIA
jgi:phosphoglycerol transferase MdoB-like AlkP superfamily enzyme